jgi:hypothetical protein
MGLPARKKQGEPDQQQSMHTELGIHMVFLVNSNIYLMARLTR